MKKFLKLSIAILFISALITAGVICYQDYKEAKALGATRTYIRNDATRTYIQAQDTTGLVGQWSLGTADISGTTVYGKGSSDQLTAVASPSLTTGFDGRANQALSFNGTTQYLTQKVYANKVGAVTMATVATGALFNDTGQDFTNYAGASGNTPYMIVVTDTSGKVAWGYIGEEGTGETLGSELLSNPSFDVSTNGWSGYLGTIASVAGGQLNNCVELTRTTGGIQDVNGGFTSVTGNLYKLSGYVKSGTSGDESSILFSYQATPQYVDVGTRLTSSSSWQQYTSIYVTAIDAGTPIAFRKNTATVGTMLFDEASAKQVLTLPANTGIKIYSTKNGVIQSWAGVDTGFLPNSIASYEVRKSDFQISEGSFSLGFWIKTSNPSQVSSKRVLTKNSLNSTNFGPYTVAFYGTNNQLRFGFYGSSGGYSLAASISADTWEFFVGTYSYSTDTLNFYKNGVLVDTEVASQKPMVNSDPFCINGPFTGGYFAGSIDNPFVYNRALTAAEVLRLYNSQSNVYIQ